MRGRLISFTLLEKGSVDHLGDEYEDDCMVMIIMFYDNGDEERRPEQGLS